MCFSNRWYSLFKAHSANVIRNKHNEIVPSFRKETCRLYPEKGSLKCVQG
jgi:hypothetical protein